MNHQAEYFKAIYSDFQSKIRILAELVKDHHGEYGTVIEQAVADLLRMFLPDRYSIGTGFVIDSAGGRSRQCDIVIYDALSSFDVFGYGGRFLFPVESVYAVIEIKKTLDNSKVKDACDNIASVKRLTTVASTELKVVRAPDGSIEYREYYPKSPFGIIIGYHSDTTKLKTIAGWFEAAFQQITDSTSHPDMAVSILEGFKFRYTSTSHREGTQEFKFYPLQARDPEGNFLRGDDGGPKIVGLLQEELGSEETELVSSVNGYGYHRRCKPVIHPKNPGGFDMADDARLLMTTLSGIAKLLGTRTSTESIFDKYFEPFFVEGIRI